MYTTIVKSTLLHKCIIASHEQHSNRIVNTTLLLHWCKTLVMVKLIQCLSCSGCHISTLMLYNDIIQRQKKCFQLLSHCSSTRRMTQQQNSRQKKSSQSFEESCVKNPLLLNLHQNKVVWEYRLSNWLLTLTCFPILFKSSYQAPFSLTIDDPMSLTFTPL